MSIIEAAVVLPLVCIAVGFFARIGWMLAGYRLADVLPERVAQIHVNNPPGVVSNITISKEAKNAARTESNPNDASTVPRD